MWIDPATKDVAVSHSDIRRLRPNWSGPDVMTDDMISWLGFMPVALVTPEYDPIRQSATELPPALLGDAWTQVWQIDDLLPTEIAANEAAAAAQVQAEMAAYLTEVRSLRERILNRLAGIGMAAIAAADQAVMDACVTARQRLLDITKAPGADTAADLDSLETAIKTEYASIVASVPDSLKTAFDQVDQ